MANTCNVIVQVLLLTGAVLYAARLPPFSVIDVSVFESAPEQVVDGTPVMLMPAGSASVNVIGERTLSLKLVTVIVSVDGVVPPAGIVAGEKVLVSAPPVWTPTLALMVGLVGPSTVFSAPAAMVLVDVTLVAVFGVRAMTSTLIVQEPEAGIWAPVASVTLAGDAALT